MYYMDSNKEKPNSQELFEYIQEVSERGFRISDDAEEKRNKLNAAANCLKVSLEKYGIDNPNSARQITGYIKSLALEVVGEGRNIIAETCYDSRTNKWTSKAEALEILADHGVEFAKEVLEYRDAKKRVESLDSLLSSMDEDRMVHPQVGLTVTNRITFSNPAIMSIHKDVLWEVLSPIKKGDRLYSVDIKNQEPHILISLSESTELYDALEAEEGLYEYMFKLAFQPTAELNIVFNRLDTNKQVFVSDFIHWNGYDNPVELCGDKKATCQGYYFNNKRVVAFERVCYNISDISTAVFPDAVSIILEDNSVARVPVEWNFNGNLDSILKKGKDTKITGKLSDVELRIIPQERKEFKVSWLSLCYGAGRERIISCCQSIDGARVYEFITNISGIKKYRSMVRKFAKKKPRYVPTVFGTPIPINGDESDKNKIERNLLDYPIQGTGADILALLIKHFNSEIMNRGLQDKMMFYMPRHDELVIEVNRSYELEVGEARVIEILNDILGHQVDDWKPFKIEIKAVN